MTDIVWFGDAGIDSAIDGPGTRIGIHDPVARIEIDRIIEGTKVFALMILACCGYNTPNM